MLYSLLLITTSILFANSNNLYKNDTIVRERISIEQQLNRDYDSLLRTFYVKKSLEDSTTTHSDTLFVQGLSIDTTNIVVDLNDSVIMRRMSEMQVLFDVSYNHIVKSFIKVYSEKRRDLTETVLGLSEYYFPFFESELDAANLPIELKYLAVIESALNPRAISRAGATGLWQFMYATGRYMGLEINSFVDDRRDVTQSTQAAIKYLQQLYSIYGDWTLALAAYNCGPGNVNKAIKRSGGRTNYWEIYYRLPRETRNYVPGFIAAMYVMEHANDYNLTPRKITMPLLTDTIELTRQIHLEQVAAVLNIPLDQLRDLNPQYRRDIIPATTKKSYPLRLPFEYATQFIDYKDSIYKYRDSIYFNPNVLIASPSKGKYAPHPPSKKHTPMYYTVAYGDNLGYISRWFNVSLNDLREWNNISKNRIRTGQQLLIYVPKSKLAYYQEFNGLDFASKQKRIGITVQPTTTTDINTTSTGNYMYYTLKRGDTLWKIAKKYEGITDHDLMQINNLTSGKDLKPGQQIKIKRID